MAGQPDELWDVDAPVHIINPDEDFPEQTPPRITARRWPLLVALALLAALLFPAFQARSGPAPTVSGSWTANRLDNLDSIRSALPLTALPTHAGDPATLLSADQIPANAVMLTTSLVWTGPATACTVILVLQAPAGWAVLGTGMGAVSRVPAITGATETAGLPPTMLSPDAFLGITRLTLSAPVPARISLLLGSVNQTTATDPWQQANIALIPACSEGPTPAALLDRAWTFGPSDGPVSTPGVSTSRGGATQLVLSGSWSWGFYTTRASASSQFPTLKYIPATSTPKSVVYVVVDVRWQLGGGLPDGCRFWSTIGVPGWRVVGSVGQDGGPVNGPLFASVFQRFPNARQILPLGVKPADALGWGGSSDALRQAGGMLVLFTAPIGKRDAVVPSPLGAGVAVMCGSSPEAFTVLSQSPRHVD